MMLFRVIAIAILSVAALTGFGQLQPEAVYRDYDWITPQDTEHFLRVGGKLDYQKAPQQWSESHFRNGKLYIPSPIDLDKAIKAEIIFERVASHEDTRNLQVSVNGHSYLPVPDPVSIPSPVSAYMFHDYPVVDLPLAHLQVNDNYFTLKVDSTQKWNWPQNIFYGIRFRIYYDKSKANIPKGELVFPEGTTVKDENISLQFRTTGKTKISEVSYVGKYVDYDYRGSRKRLQWQYGTHRSALMGHIGTEMVEPYQINWNTSWIPDQENPIYIVAIAKSEDDLCYVTPLSKPLTYERNGYEIKLYFPKNVPENWATREAIYSEDILIADSLQLADAYQLSWRSWSPCYMNGLYINDRLVVMREGPCYDYYLHKLDFKDVSVWQKGENTLTTGKTPLYNGQMVHGMEVQWPGIMVKIKYHRP